MVKVLLRYLGVLFICGLLWKGAAFCVSGGILPQPEVAIMAFLQALGTAIFWQDFFASSLRVVSAMTLAWCVAFPLGLVMGSNKRIDSMLAPFIFLTYPIPKIVLLPIFLLLFGLGNSAKIGMIALILGYQILVTTRDGVRAVHTKYYDSVRSLGGNFWHILLEVLIPAALPHGFTSLRLGTGVAVAVLFFVESFATQQGLGYRIMDAWGRMDYVGMFTAILGMSLLGAILYEVANLMEKRLCRWMYAGRK